MEMKGWLARDKNGALLFYVDTPKRREYLGIFDAEAEYIELPEDSFPEVTWESSPVEVTIKIEKIRLN